MKKLIILLIAALIIGHLLTELSIFIQWQWPKTRDIYIHPFIRSSYHWYDPKGVNMLWWIYYCTNDFLWIIVMFVMAKIALNYSWKLFLVSCVYFVYHLVDAFMLWYDYKQTGKAYFLLEVFSIFAIVCLFIPDRKEGVIRSMK